MTSRTILCLLVVLITGCSFSFAQQRTCTKSEYKKADLCMQRFAIYGDRQHLPWPNSKPELDDFCGKTKEDERCIKDFSKKCLNAFSKQIAGLLVRGMSNVLKRLCNKLPPQEVISHSKCGNTEKERQNVCMELYVTEMKKVARAGDAIKDMGYVCCLFHKFKSCVSNVIKKLPTCTAANIEYFITNINGIGAEVLELSCGPFPFGSDKCAKLLVELPKLPVKGKSSSAKSFLLPLIEIVNNL